MTKHVIERVYLGTETLGSWYDDKGQLICKTMELPWNNNERNISCIPEGVYIIEKQKPKEDRKYGYFRFRAVKGRSINRYINDSEGKPMSSILVHRITYVKDLLGCIGVGSRFADLNKDGVPDMAASSVKLEWMYKNLPDIIELTIIKKHEKAV